MLNFLKSPDYSLKFNIPYRSGNLFVMKKMPESLKLFKHSEFNIKLTDYQPKVEPDIPFMFQLNKLKH